MRLIVGDDRFQHTLRMLSRVHSSNMLNEPAAKVSSQVLKWVVPQLMQCWDDRRISID